MPFVSCFLQKLGNYWSTTKTLNSPKGRNPRAGVLMMGGGIPREGGARFRHRLLYEVLRDAPRLVLIKHAVHQRDLRRASASFGFCRTILDEGNGMLVIKPPISTRKILKKNMMKRNMGKIDVNT